MNAFESQLDEFCAKVYPKGMAPEQRRQIRAAFIAGGWIHQILTTAACKLPDPKTEEYLAALFDEIQALADKELKMAYLLISARN